MATIANATIVLADAGWDGGGIGADGWAIILLAVGALLAAVRLRRHVDVAFAAVLVWAFAGIAVAQAGTVTAKGAQLAAVYVVFEAVLPEVSSTEVRRRAAAGEPLEGLVPGDVAAYVAERRLYRG